MTIVSLCLLSMMLMTPQNQNQDPAEHVVVASPDRIIDVRPVTGIYSNFFNRFPEINGMEIFVVYADRSPYVIMQVARKRTGVPFVVKAKLERQDAPLPAVLDFDVPKDKGDWGHFHGYLDGRGLKGTFQGNQTTVDLPRKSSYWQ